MTGLYNLKSDDSVISSFDYAYDQASRRTSVVEASGDRVTWAYDAADQLINEHRSGPNTYNTTLTYDGMGNRLVKETDVALTTMAYDLANQIETSEEASGITSYEFDGAGNQRLTVSPSGAITTNTWNDENRLVGVALADGGKVTSTYNADGLRYERQDPEGTTRFVWDDQNYLAETNESDESQAVYTNEPQVYGNLISQYRKTGGLWLPSYCHFDALGSTRELTDANQNISDTALYDAWGGILVRAGTTKNPFLYVGRLGYYYDEATGLYQIRARDLWALIARWLSVDPIGYRGGSNIYRYCGYSPLTRTDPSGSRWSISVYDNGKGQLCGYSIWLLTGSWCEGPDEVLAATDAHEKYTTCWWDCEVSVHQKVTTYVCEAAVASSVVAFTHLEINKGAVRQGVGTPGSVTTLQSALALWLAQQGYKGVGYELLKQGRLQASGRVVSSAVESAVAGIAIVETVVAWACAWKCS
jgi:RHS repeat-associated protein